MPNYLVLDFETTGLDHEVHEPTQVAAILLDDQLCEQAAFTSLIRPERPELASPEAMATQGRTIQDLRNSPLPSPVFAILESFVAQADGTPIIVGHNADFDLKFLLASEKRHGFKMLRGDGPPCDTCQIARLHLQAHGLIEDARLGTVAAYYGIEFAAHDALNDIRATAECLRRFKAEAPELVSRAEEGKLLAGLLADANAAAPGNDFVVSCTDGYRTRGFLSPKQITALVSVVQRTKRDAKVTRVELKIANDPKNP